MKLKIWYFVKRYGPGEIIASTSALTSAMLAYKWTGNGVASAVTGAWVETLVFYVIMAAQEVRKSRKSLAETGEKYKFGNLWRTVRDLMVEFGPAEFLDTYIIRPFAMFIFPVLIHNRLLGLFVGKVIADVAFYLPSAITYELMQLRKSRKADLSQTASRAGIHDDSEETTTSEPT